MDIDTVAFDEAKNALVIIDQTKLPSVIEVLELTDIKDIWEAIKVLRVRGAPAIGVAAAIGIYIAANKIETTDYNEFVLEFDKALEYLNSSRPTAVNLSWALKEMRSVVAENSDKNVSEIKSLLKNRAIEIREQDIETCRKIGEYGLSLVKKGDGLLTHCNAGKLATIKYGTATAPMYLGHERGYDFKIYCDETRPLLQGARLTAFELSASGLDVTLQCDNMSASLMKKGLINAVFVGCDRVAANGDVANKIGTSLVAAAAKLYNVPFYVCAPTSTIDMNTATGEEIVIEERNGDEVTEMWYKQRMAPTGIKVYNPSFDVTDNSLITAIITEKGIVKAPFDKGLAELFQ